MIKNVFKLNIFFIFIFVLSLNDLFADDTIRVKYWIFFKDKGQYNSETIIVKNSPAYIEGLNFLNERAINRRLKVLTEDKLIDFGDLPLNNDYIKSVENLGVEITAKSRWLNGVSAYLTKSQKEKVINLPFVTGLKAGANLYKQEIVSLSPVETGDKYHNQIFVESANYNLNYGKSLQQLEVLNVPRLHNYNIIGKGVLIASLDDGFMWKEHEALKDMKVIQEYDFINKDSNTAIESIQKYKDSQSQGAHGTATISVLGGYKEGKLIGSAFGSEFILAKSEYVSSETPMEEDFWLEATEWAESKGVDIITSSLVYKTYDPPYVENSYEYKNLDGKTAITSIAASRAAYLGVIVLNAMGNYFQTETPSLGSAADADSIISVGAVSVSGKIANFSSNGPTSDGRIKPDVTATGVNVFVAGLCSNQKNNIYEFSNGTSFSTPLTAGICALILSVHPELTPMQVREALRNTASKNINPDNIMGWGIVNAYDAVLYNGIAFSNFENFIFTKEGAEISVFIASQEKIDLNSVKIYYKKEKEKNFNHLKMNYVDMSNDITNSGEYKVFLKGLKNDSTIHYYFSVKDMNGNEFFYPKNSPESYRIKSFK